MSMDGLTKLVDWMGDAKPSKVFWVIFIFVYGVLLFEQFTGHYRLTRLEKSIAVMTAMEPGSVQEAIRIDVERRASEMFVPKHATPVFFRMVCGGAPFLLLAITSVLASPSRCFDFGKFLLLWLLFGGLVVLIPDFLPTWLECLYVTGVIIVGSGFHIVDSLNDPLG